MYFDTRKPKLEELLTMFKVTIEDIERMKQYQWKLFYYTIILQIGLLSLFRICIFNKIDERIPIDVLKFFFIFLTVIVFIVGYTVVNGSQNTIKTFRSRKVKILSGLHSDIQKLFEGEDNKSQVDKLFTITLGVVSFVFSIYYWLYVK